MSVKFIICDSKTGAILRIGECLEIDILAQARPGETVYRGQADETKQFIDLGTHSIRNFMKMQARMERLPDIDGAEVYKIVDLPPGTQVTVNEDDIFQLEGDDTSIEFSFPDNGLYTIVCSKLNYEPAVFEADVVIEDYLES